MWINPNSMQVFRSHAEVRAAFPNVSFSDGMGDAELEGVGLYRLQAAPAPSFNTLTHRCDKGQPAQVNGVWTETWNVTALPTEESVAALAYARETMAKEVRAIRDRKMLNGGYQVNGKWFHSDLVSRIQQIGLNMVGQGIPPRTRWKTMDGTFLTMTPNVAQGIFAAAMQQDLALFEHGEQLLAAVDASSDPESIDITAGWPATYGDA